MYKNKFQPNFYFHQIHFICFLFFHVAECDIANYDKWICKSWFFLNHIASTLSSWVLISVITERLIVIYFPLKAKSISTKKESFTVVITIFLLSCVAYIHYFWSLGYKRNSFGEEINKCSISHEYPILDYYITIRPWQDFVVRSAAPFIILLSSNIAMIGKLQCELNKRKKLINSTASVNNKDQ